MAPEGQERKKRGRPRIAPGRTMVGALLSDSQAWALAHLQSRWGCSASEALRRALLIAAAQT